MHSRLIFLIKIFLFTISSVLSTVSLAQINGVVMDNTTLQPVIGASVYINNTTYGCQSDMDGRFDLKVFPKPPFQIIISSVGYESASFNIKEQQTTNIKIALKPKATDINEVLILAPEKDGLAKYGKEFIRDFIGYSEFAKECKIINKEVLQFRYDKQNMQLSISAEQPLKIRNKATGYLITYWLVNYEKNYQTRKLFYKGSAQFEKLNSIKDKVNKQWQVNRRLAYLGSLNHFMRSVYSNTVYKDSFMLQVLKRFPADEYGQYVPEKTDTFITLNDSVFSKMVIDYLHYDTMDIKELQQQILVWSNHTDSLKPIQIDEKRLGDTIYRRIVFQKNPDAPQEKWAQYFDVRSQPEDVVMLKGINSLTDANGQPVRFPKNKKKSYSILYTKKMSLDSFVTRGPGKEVVFKFKDCLLITYLNEKEETNYIQNQFPRTHEIPKWQRSIINIENPEGIHISADGNYFDPYDLIVEEYWSYEKMDKMTPLDYQIED